MFYGVCVLMLFKIKRFYILQKLLAVERAATGEKVVAIDWLIWHILNQNFLSFCTLSIACCGLCENS